MIKSSGFLSKQYSAKLPCQHLNWRILATGGNAMRTITLKCRVSYQFMLATNNTAADGSLWRWAEMPFPSKPPPGSNSPRTWPTILGPLQRTGSSWVLTNKVTLFYWAFADVRWFNLNKRQLFKSTLPSECQAALMLIWMGREVPLLVPFPWWL